MANYVVNSSRIIDNSNIPPIITISNEVRTKIIAINPPVRPPIYLRDCCCKPAVCCNIKNCCNLNFCQIINGNFNNINCCRNTICNYHNSKCQFDNYNKINYCNNFSSLCVNKKTGCNCFNNFCCIKHNLRY